jgi:hypothetical protein
MVWSGVSFPAAIFVLLKLNYRDSNSEGIYLMEEGRLQQAWNGLKVHNVHAQL